MRNQVFNVNKILKNALLFFWSMGVWCPLAVVASMQYEIPDSTVLHYKDSHGVPVVSVAINGNDYSFLFDTGAQITCVSDKVGSEGKLTTRGTNNYIIGMDWNISYTTVPSIVLGNMTVDSLEAIVLPGNNPSLRVLGIDGIIGANMLADIVVTFDSKSKTITLLRHALDEKMDWVPMKLWDGLPLLALKLRGAEELYDVPGVFDSGSSIGAFGLPSVQGFEEWTTAGLIEGVEEGRGTTTLMLGGRVGMDKLYRGQLKECHIGDGVFPGIPVYTGGRDYLLLCFKITDLGRLTLDYPNRRFSFTAYPNAAVWEGDRRPVTTAVVNGELKITTVWGGALLGKIAPGDTVVAFDDKPTGRVPAGVPNIDVFINMIHAQSVSVRDATGKVHALPASLFLVK